MLITLDVRIHCKGTIVQRFDCGAVHCVTVHSSETDTSLSLPTGHTERAWGQSPGCPLRSPITILDASIHWHGRKAVEWKGSGYTSRTVCAIQSHWFDKNMFVYVLIVQKKLWKDRFQNGFNYLAVEFGITFVFLLLMSFPKWVWFAYEIRKEMLSLKLSEYGSHF